MKIYAPVKGVNGIYASVRFVDGVGETDNPILISWFESHGYRLVDESHIATVEMSEKIPNISDENSAEKSDEPDFDAMTPYELREWGRANGFAGKIKNTRDKEKLLKIIRG